MTNAQVAEFASAKCAEVCIRAHGKQPRRARFPGRNSSIGVSIEPPLIPRASSVLSTEMIKTRTRGLNFMNFCLSEGAWPEEFGCYPKFVFLRLW